jgi:ketosteroid isomerase-like protein
MPILLRRGLAAAALVLASPLSTAFAQPAAEQAAVARAVDALTRAMLARDKAQLEALSAPALSYGHSAGRIENRQQFVEALVSGPTRFRTINLTEQTVELTGNEAIVRHLLTGETENREGQVNPVRIGVLQVWQKQGGDWKLLARQAYRL